MIKPNRRPRPKGAASNHRSRFLLPASLLTVLSGCAISPADPQPAAIVGIADQHAYVFDRSPGGETGSVSSWWQQLGGRELDGLVTQLQRQSVSIMAAQARVDQALALARISGAQRRPAISVSANGGQQRGNSFLPGQSRTTPEWATVYRSALNADWNLDLFGAERASERAAQLRAQSAAVATASLRQALVAELVRGYIAAWSLRRQIDINRDLVAGFERTATLTDRRQRAGSRSASLLDVQIARQNAASASAALPQLEARLRNQISAIDVLLAQPPGTVQLEFEAVTAADALATLPVGQPADLLRRRPDVALAELNWRAAQLDLGAARFRRLPSLDLTLSFSHQTERASDLLDIDDWVGTVLAGLFAPLYQGGRLQANVRQAEGVTAELAADYAAAALGALADVERALVNADSAKTQLARRGESLSAAEVANQLATVRYKAGQVSLLTLLETRRALDSARQDHVLAEQAVLDARIDLTLALGGDWFGQADNDPVTASAADGRRVLNFTSGRSE